MENQSETETVLYDPNKKAGQLVKIACASCGYEGEPHKWAMITIIALLYLVIGFNVFVLIVMLLIANPYTCIKCGERKGLTKVINNGKRIPIKSLSKKSYLIASVAGIVIPFLLIVSFLILLGN